MNASHPNGSREIKAQLVADELRPLMLPKHFGAHLLATESLVYQFARKLVPAYVGGYWNFYELTNGGFYMAPEMKTARVYVEGNGFDGELSADAIGITVCLFAFSHASFQFSDDPHSVFPRLYGLLRHYSHSHPEARMIAAAID